MKKIANLVVILLLTVFNLMAQAPEKFTYQAVVRNANNTLVTNSLVSVRISILRNSSSGSVVYSETQMLSTNANGLVTMNVGEGNATYGNISNINWDNGTYFLKSEIDPNGGSNYSISSTQQLLSVPYSLFAKEAGNGFSGNYNDLTNTPTNISAFNNNVGYITSADLQTLVGQLNNRMDSLQTVLSAQSEDILDLSNSMDSLEAFVDSLRAIIEACGCGHQENVCGIATVTDIDGNVYSTVGIGTQCWLKENLRTKHYSDGTYIEVGTGSYSLDPARYYPNGDSTTVPTYGYLYNWKAVMRNDTTSNLIPSGVQGPCPSGWHVPSKAEWLQLVDYVSGQAAYACNGDSQKIAKALAAKTGWMSSYTNCSPGKLPDENNATGFSILPAGFHSQGSPGFGDQADLWSSSQVNNIYAWNIYLNYDLTSVDSNHSANKDAGNSVRCLQD